VIILSYVEAAQIRTDICAHFHVVDNVSSVLCVRTHGTGAVSLVVVFAGLLGVERQAADRALQRGGGVHSGGVVRGTRRVPVFLLDVVVVVSLLLYLRRSRESSMFDACASHVTI
jgi:hypothetical protein